MDSDSHNGINKNVFSEEGVFLSFDDRIILILSRFLARDFFKKACIKKSDKIIDEYQCIHLPVLPEAKLGRRLSLTEKREWYRPLDIEEVYGISRKTLEWIRKDAKEKGMPLEVSNMMFANGSKTGRKRPFILISRKSLEEYIAAYSDR